jgi:hypothetical protein
VWVARVVRLENAAVPGLLGQLGKPEERICSNAAAALDELACHWGLADPRTVELIQRLAEGFPHLSPKGQQQVLKLLSDWSGPERRDSLVGASVSRDVARILVDAARVPNEEVHAAALQLAWRLAAQADDADLLLPCRELILASLPDVALDNRVAAVKLASLPGVDLLAQLAPLLDDAAPEVRRLVMLAIGCAERSQSEKAILTDHLMRWLQDSDEEVRRLCEETLKGRGLSPQHLQLARLITDPRPSVRLQVLRKLRPSSELDTSIWLRHLSHDSESAVRIASMSAAADYHLGDLSDRLDQMAQADPSPTVRQLARYYLRVQSSRRKGNQP